ncbi:transposase, MuDR, MULE transposase domain protein [Tanacetum coccineum]
MHHRNATAKLLGHLLEPKLKDNSRIYKGKEIKHDIYTDLNIDITYKQAWRSKNVALESLSGCHVVSFAQLPYYCHNLEMKNDGTVTHIETDNEDRFKMVFIAFGIVGETGPSWTWFLSKLKECIGEVPNLSIVSDRHATIKLACQAVFPNAFQDFNMAINELGATRPDVYHKLTEAGVEKWSRAYCPSDRYNYMMSNSTESINSLTRDVRKISITNLIEWYRDLVQRWYIVYHVDDRQRMHTVELYSGTCTCQKWQLSGLSYGHVLAVCRVMGLTYFNHLAKGWFRRKALEGTYQELVYPVGEVSSWQHPNYLQVVKSPLMDKKLAGRPKSKARIRSQGEELVLVRYGRCGVRRHNRNSCRETIPQKKAKTGYSQQEHYYSEQEHYYSQ